MGSPERGSLPCVIYSYTIRKTEMVKLLRSWWFPLSENSYTETCFLLWNPRFLKSIKGDPSTDPPVSKVSSFRFHSSYLCKFEGDLQSLLSWEIRARTEGSLSGASSSPRVLSRSEYLTFSEGPNLGVNCIWLSCFPGKNTCKITDKQT